jgi:hypothetical protein
MQSCFVGIDKGELVDTVLGQRVCSALTEACDAVLVLFYLCCRLCCKQFIKQDEIIVTRPRFCDESHSGKNARHSDRRGYISIPWIPTYLIVFVQRDRGFLTRRAQNTPSGLVDFARISKSQRKAV